MTTFESLMNSYAYWIYLFLDVHVHFLQAQTNSMSSKIETDISCIFYKISFY